MGRRAPWTPTLSARARTVAIIDRTAVEPFTAVLLADPLAERQKRRVQ